MGLFLRKSQSNTEQIDELAGLSPAAQAIALLDAAAAAQPDGDALVIEERAVWQPDSWLLQRCWRELAAPTGHPGAGQEALQVAALLETRNPLARVQSLYEVARHAHQDPDVRKLLAQEIRRLRVGLFDRETAPNTPKLAEQLLYVGAAAAQLGNIPLAAACLERMDQLERTWDRIYISMETRNVLAEVVVRIGLHPLTNHLLAIAIRRYEEPGAQFLHQIMRLIAAQMPERAPARGGRGSPRLARRTARLMQRCVDVFRFSTLSTLTSRRLAAAAFGQAGAVRDVLEQVETIANVQAARQETGMGGGRTDPHFLRQVKRPTANLDVDFQAYALQEAIKAMPVRAITREDRIRMADRVAELATQSDGWTAAGAAATLVELGALRYAVSVVDFIPPTDATRSEGVISLVRALLRFGETRLADEQVEKAIAWANSLPSRNPERALIWGLAEVYLEPDAPWADPQRAIELLDLRVARSAAERGFGARMRRLFSSAPNDDELRDNRLRFQALILHDARNAAHPDALADPENAPLPAAWSKEQEALYRQLRQWAPRLLDGETLVNFYVEGLLRPLLTANKTDLVIQLLPEIRAALQHSTGDKHTVHIRKVTALLARVIHDSIAQTSAVASHQDDSDPNHGENNGENNGAPHPSSFVSDPSELHAACTEFLLALWSADAPRGIWQMVHSLEGSLPLLLALEGPQALVAIAHHTAESGQAWSA